MTVAQTSLWSYGNLKGLTGKRAEVYNVILNHGPICNADIADLLGWSINRVTGRTKELRELLKVQEAYKKRYQPTGQLVTYWQVR